MEITLTLKDEAKIMKVFKQAPGIAAKEYRKSLERVASSVYSKAVRNSPVGRYSGGGNLRQSIKKIPYGTTGFIVLVNAHYGVYVDQGTKPHVIYPRRAKALSWIGRDGTRVFSKRVNHPGTKATHFFTSAVKESERYANKEMKDATTRILKQITT